MDSTTSLIGIDNINHFAPAKVTKRRAVKHVAGLRRSLKENTTATPMKRASMVPIVKRWNLDEGLFIYVTLSEVAKIVISNVPAHKIPEYNPGVTSSCIYVHAD